MDERDAGRRDESLRFAHGRSGGLPRPFLPLPLAIVDERLPALTGCQLKLLLVVARQTVGFRDPKTGERKAEDWLTHKRLMAMTGCASQAVSAAVDALVRGEMIEVQDEAGEELATPQARRSARRLFYRLHPGLLGPWGGTGTSPAPRRATLKSGLRFSKTTIEKKDKRMNSFIDFEKQRREEKQGRQESSHGESRWVWNLNGARWVREGKGPR